jgi:GNAT superfamily N-acetyltransferase
MGVADEVRVRLIDLDRVIDLRHRVLRAGLPRETAVFSGDEAETSVHLGAFDGERLIGCATLHLNEYEGAPAWQLRGMAVDDGYRGGGVGSRLLRAIDQIVRARGKIRQLWCNARLPAHAFYERNGWRVDSEPFEVPTAGPHVRMSRRLADPLVYAPGPVFSRRRSARQHALMMLVGSGIVVGCIIAAFEWLVGRFGAPMWFRYFLYPLLAVVVVGVCIVALRLLRRGGFWEARIEGDTLYLTRPGRATRVIPVEQIDRWIRRWVTRKTAESETETTLCHELCLRDGQRIRLDLYHIGSLRPLRRALRQANPRIAVETLRGLQRRADDTRRPSLPA